MRTSKDAHFHAPVSQTEAKIRMVRPLYAHMSRAGCPPGGLACRSLSWNRELGFPGWELGSGALSFWVIEWGGGRRLGVSLACWPRSHCTALAAQRQWGE